jgi:RimJ/RimL family protein N-acetyltransferase
MVTTIPTLETKRLLLRANRADDLPAFTAMWQQPAFYKFLGGRALPEEEVWTKLLRHLGAWLALGYGYWAIEEKATGLFIGAIGFADWQRQLVPSLKGYPEVGWVLAPAVHGKGYASEAAQAVLAWGDAYLAQKRTVCIISPDNVPSLRLAAKFGYQEVAHTLYKEQPIVVLERFAPR